ncbi:MAG: hypothetical protein ACKV22_03995 [Bryobacteraceae bacterium]
MDYEFRIHLLETETAHLKEMLQIARERQDTADNRLDRLQSITLNAANTVDKLAATVDVLAGKMDALVEALLRQHSNGH